MMSLSAAIAVFLKACVVAQTTAAAAGAASQPADLVRDPYASGWHTFGLPGAYSTEAPKIDFLYEAITWISIFFFLLNVGVMVWFMYKYRRRSNTEFATSDVTHNTPLELTWTIIPLLLVIAMFYVGLEGFLNLRRAPIGAYEVHVSAARWSWTFQHPNGATEGDLRVPVGRPVKLIMESKDVLHACFIPAFRVKQDIVPGRVTTLWFEVTQPGDFDLFCAQYCGKDHSNMHARVYARPQAQFEADLQEVADWAKKTPDDQLYVQVPNRIYPRCQSCHSLDGKDGTGPTWRGVWKKIEEGEVVFNDGTNLKDLTGKGKMFESAEDYVKQSILTPQQKIVMNFTGAMPTFKGQLTDREIRAVWEFLKHLDEFDDKGKAKPNSPAAKIEEQLKAKKP
jgi:cytochrome c oxidase subunit II